MLIAPDDKFACFAFILYGIAEDVPEEVQLGPRLWATRTLPLDVAKHWDEWLGSAKMSSVRDANFVMCATKPSTHPEDYDQDNLDVVKTLDYLLYGILLHGVPEYEQGFLLSGANVDGEANVRKFSDLRHYQPSAEIPEFKLGLTDLQRAAGIVERLRTVNTGGADWARLRRGLKVLFDGTTLSNKDGDRLHQFVRALEALVKPEVMRTRKQFADRISRTFTCDNEETRKILLQIFDLRSYVEHMHPVLDALAGDEATRIATISRRTRQVDFLARCALRRVLESDALTENFRSDVGIDGFWRMPNAERLTVWGQRVDIRMVE